VRAETLATHAAFRDKRDRMLSRLERLGIRADRAPDGTFYVWAIWPGCLRPERRDGFFGAALDHKIITVPASFST